LVEIREAEEAAMAESGDHPTFNHQHRILRFGLVAGFIGTGGQDADAVMPGHFLIGGVEVGFVAASTADACAGVIGDDQLGNSA